MGHVVFGEMRKRKSKTISIVLVVLIALQVVVVGITTMGWFSPEFGAKLNQFLGATNSTIMLVASIAMFMVGSGMLAMAHFTDFTRGYYIAFLMAVAVFFMVLFNAHCFPSSLVR